MGTPIRRTRRTAALGFDGAVAIHLREGDCFLAGAADRQCGCGLTDEDGELRAETASHLWQAHRDEVMKLWPHRWPCFAQVIFDGQRLPDWRNPSLSEADARELEMLHAEVERAKG